MVEGGERVYMRVNNVRGDASDDLRFCQRGVVSDIGDAVGGATAGADLWQNDGRKSEKVCETVEHGRGVVLSVGLRSEGKDGAYLIAERTNGAERNTREQTTMLLPEDGRFEVEGRGRWKRGCGSVGSSVDNVGRFGWRGWCVGGGWIGGVGEAGGCGGMRGIGVGAEVVATNKLITDRAKFGVLVDKKVAPTW